LKNKSIWLSEEVDDDLLEKETKCGMGFLQFPWLQKLASKKVYVVVYGLIGAAQFALASYFVGTISTMEKRFQIPSTFSGVLTVYFLNNEIITLYQPYSFSDIAA